MPNGKRMRSDWGCVTKERVGVWRIRYWAETSQGYRRCSETVRGTRRQAGDRLAELRLLHGHDAPCPTVGACWERWYLPDRIRMVEQGDLARQSLTQYRSTWRCHVKDRWANKPADTVLPIDVQQWLISLSRVAAESSLHLLRQILDYPTRYGFISTNPLSIRYLLPSSKTTIRREDGVWSPQSLGEVWRASWNMWFEPAVLLAGFGGCRVGESLGVRAKDVKHKEVSGVPITFAQIVRQIDSQGRELDKTKNKWSTRTTLLAGMPAKRLYQLACNCTADSYITRPPHKDHASQRELRESFKQCLERKDVELHLFKNLRKTWQTNARWALRLPPWVIEPMMGHTGEGITGRHYDKPSEDAFAQLLADAWREHPFGDAYEWFASHPTEFTSV